MRHIILATSAAFLVSGIGGSARSADDNEAKTIVDQAIQSIGGEAKLRAAKVILWKTKGKLRFGDNENRYTAQATAAGLDQFRSEFDGEFGGNSVKGVTVLDGNRGWRKFGDNNMPLDSEGVANEKRTVYLQVVPVTLVALKSGDFRLEKAADKKVTGADAAGVKVTAPDGKDFTIFFDKTSHLPIKVVANVRSFRGDEFLQETIYGAYKEFDGIKKATKIEAKRNGETFLEAEITEFKVADKAAPEAFAEPK
jgi:hypothetical protein